MKFFVSFVAVAAVFAQTANCQSSDCSWSDADCVAADINEVVEDTFIEPIVTPVTDEIRDLGDGDPYTSDDSSSSDEDSEGSASPQ